jgi:misacylated tRNA(Ala) deacylase
MSSEPLFISDSYLREFNAVVEHIDEEENAVILSQTAFFPGGGGQPCDTGVLVISGQEFPVTKTKKKDEHILHLIAGSLPAKNSEVAGKIDWQRRYHTMRTHTALHIMCGVIWRDYQAHVTGGNMEPLRGRLDFEFETLNVDLVKEIEEKLNVEMEAARDVRIRILPREEAFQIPDLIRTKINLLPESLKEIRTIEIVGLDIQADGGTHVANTKEVGPIRIVKHKSKGRINKRLEIALEPTIDL